MNDPRQQHDIRLQPPRIEEVGRAPLQPGRDGKLAPYVFVRDNNDNWSQEAYVKASNSGIGDFFGYSVALSGDGATLAVSAYREDSSATGVGGNQTDNSAADAGAVYVFVRDGNNNWSQQAYVKASNGGANDQFGIHVALSGDGSSLAVGAPYEGSSTTGIGGSQADNSATDAGAVYVFVRDGQNSLRQGLKHRCGRPLRQWGGAEWNASVLAVPAFFEDSGATGLWVHTHDIAVGRDGDVVDGIELVSVSVMFSSLVSVMGMVSDSLPPSRRSPASRRRASGETQRSSHSQAQTELSWILSTGSVRESDMRGGSSDTAGVPLELCDTGTQRRFAGLRGLFSSSTTG